jgi:hypothetical protein
MEIIKMTSAKQIMEAWGNLSKPNAIIISNIETLARIIQNADKMARAGDVEGYIIQLEKIEWRCKEWIKDAKETKEND